jgi:hypothetical protein
MQLSQVPPQWEDPQHRAEALSARVIFRLSDNLNLSALKGEDSQATLRITTLTLAPEGRTDPTRLVFRRGLTPSQQPFMCLGFRSS